MNFNQFKREVALAAQGNVPPDVASVERALRKKEYLRCAQALSQFAAVCLEVQRAGDRPARVALPPKRLPPVV